MLEGSHIGALHRRPGRDDAPSCADLRHAILAHWRLRPRVANDAIDIAGTDMLAFDDPIVKREQNLACRLARGGRPRESDEVAMRTGIDTEPFLDQGQMRVVLAEQVG